MRFMNVARAHRNLVPALVLLAASALAALALAAPAQGADRCEEAPSLGLCRLEVRFLDQQGQRIAVPQAGSHPFAMETFLQLNSGLNPEAKLLPSGGDLKDLSLSQARGFVGSATAVQRCPTIDFVTEKALNTPACAPDTAVGITSVLLNNPHESLPAPVYNLTPPPGIPARLGFVVEKVPTVIDVSVKPSPDYNVLATLANTPQPLTVFGAATQLWGVPADPAHDFARDKCAFSAFKNGAETLREGALDLKDPATEASPHCPAEAAAEKAFLTLPRACGPAPDTRWAIDSWSAPGAFVMGAVATGPFGGCEGLAFEPRIASTPSTDSASTGTGLDFSLDFEDPVEGSDGLSEAGGRAQSDLKRIEVELPRGMTADPSLAEGLEVCTPAELGRETLASGPGEGCPEGAKIGSVAVTTPLLGEPVDGNVFIAQPDDPATGSAGAENPFDSLIAFYIVLKNTKQGILVKVPAEVAPDPATGQLITTVDDTPQIPFSRFSFHFREGQRPPLITPPACGVYTTLARMTPWARPGEVITRSASLRIDRGAQGGPCPSGAPPFHPGFEAGTDNNAAGRYSPFAMRLTRQDGEADMSRLSATLPPGVLGRLAGLSRCPEAAIALASARTGLAERERPSCPESSQIGSTLAAAGVGSALTYVPGSLYLAGPYHGDPLSVVAITPAVAGPFDAGTVVVREALTLDPVSGEVQVDGAASDPIPHILKGIPLNLRELRVRTDRPGFTLNATDCTPSATRATLWSAGSIFDPAPESPAALSARYQAAGCAALGFKPRLALRLRGGRRRGAHPRAARGAAGAAGRRQHRARRAALAALGLPRAGAHPHVCTRVQFAANGTPLPPGAVYGHVTAYTPLLDEPLRGPVYLRSSSHKLPDLVFDLHGHRQR